MNARNIAMRVVLSLIIATAGVASAGARAQTISISINTFSACDNSVLGNVAVQLNGEAYRTNANGEAFSQMPSNVYNVEVRAAAPGVPPGKVAYVLFAEAGKSGQQKYSADMSGVARFSPGNGGALLVYMGACAAKTIKVKIATTRACTDKAGEGFHIQEGVAVNIGGKVFTSNANGVIEAEMPAGTYSVTASWKDYPLGYVAQNGLRQKQNENGMFSVRVGGSGETLEVRMLTCDPDGQPKARAVITAIGVNGAGLPATIRVIRSKFHGNAFVAMKLRDGDQVVVNGTATWKWLQGNRTISFENPKQGTLVLIGPDYTPAGSKPPESTSVFQVLKGIVDFLTPASEPDVPRFTPSTHTFVAAEKGTQFSVGYDPATQSGTVVVRQGSVLVTPRNTTLKSVTLQAAQQVAVTLNHVGSIKGRSGVIATQSAPQSGKRITPSAHGCFGFNGTWQGPGGTMRIRNGSGSYSDTTLQGAVFENVLRGTWRHPTVGQGTFVFTLASDGDSFTTIWTNSSGVSGSFDTVRCIGR
jgi:hypothetical protein